MTFEIYFAINFMPKMSNNCLKEEMFIIYFYSLNVKGNWRYLADKNTQPGEKSLHCLCYHENILILLSEKHFKNMFCFDQLNHLMLF